MQAGLRIPGLNDGQSIVSNKGGTRLKDHWEEQETVSPFCDVQAKERRGWQQGICWEGFHRHLVKRWELGRTKVLVADIEEKWDSWPVTRVVLTKNLWEQRSPSEQKMTAGSLPVLPFLSSLLPLLPPPVWAWAQLHFIIEVTLDKILNLCKT